MNVLDYSIRLGKILRKTEEGKNLYQLKMNIEEKYKGNSEFNQYMKFAERNTSQYYFYSWDMAYKTFLNVLTDDTIEHRNIFMPTAELVESDEDVKRLALLAKTFGDIFEQIVAVCISGGDYERIVPNSWKYKIRNAISDVQVAVERTLLSRTIALYYQKNQGILDNIATKNYLAKREEKKLLPFSHEALEIMAETVNVSEEEKMLYEKMHLIMEAVKKGVFYGFCGMINEVEQEELIMDEDLYCSHLKEVTFSHRNNYSSFFGEGWLYKIQLENEHIFFMAHKKEVRFGNDNESSMISGIVYPADDRVLFGNEG